MRDRYVAFIARHDVAWELTFAGLAVAYVVIGFVADGATGWTASVLNSLDLGLTVVFATEFVSRLAATRDRAGYLKGHWIDLVALIPTARSLRILRILRLLRLVRAFAGVARALAGVQRFANHRTFIYLLIAWVAVMGLCSIALYAAENGVNKAVTTPLDALWWGITTMTTVGYGDVVPVTPEGRIAAVILMVLGIGLFSAVTATVTSILITGPGGGQNKADQIREMARLRDDGLITEDQFESARDALLRRVGE